MLSNVNSESAKLNGGLDEKMSSNDTANRLYTSNGDDKSPHAHLHDVDGHDMSSNDTANRLYTSNGDDKSPHAHLHGTDGRDVFVVSDGVGSSDLDKTTHIIDFNQSQDVLEFPKGLPFERVNLSQSTQEHSVGTVISDKVTGENLAVLVGVDSTTLNQRNFIAAHRDPVLNWNAELLETIRSEKLLPPQASRALAEMHTAVFDAVNAIDKKYESYFVKDVNAPKGASHEAAVDAAAHRVLEGLFPAKKSEFDQLLNSSLADVSNGKSKDDGIALGNAVADKIVAWRSGDETRELPPDLQYTSGDKPGNWQPTPPKFSPPHFQQWPKVTPWAIKDSAQFRLEGPPGLDSSKYAGEFNEVKNLGKQDSLLRTPDQTESTLFWNDAQGTYLPPGHWNQIAEQAALSHNNTLSENAHLFAQLNIGMADALISAWDAKTHYNFWRPITAIQKADQDGNSETMGDPTWTPLLPTPPFQEYVSAHSVVSGAASEILASTFGDKFHSITTSAGLPGVHRESNSFSETAKEIGASRLYGGIHFRTAIDDGLAQGKALGSYVIGNTLLPHASGEHGMKATPIG